MGLEMERKFLVKRMDWDALGEGTVLRQGYIPTEGNMVVRVRLGGGEAFLAVKGPDAGAGRLEFEYRIPPDDAEEMLIRLCRKPVIEKTRHRVPFEGLVWEVDVFHGDNEGLVVAEVEISAPDEAVKLPPWVTEEVTGDPKYSNARLVGSPFCTWTDRDRH